MATPGRHERLVLPAVTHTRRPQGQPGQQAQRQTETDTRTGRAARRERGGHGAHQ
ncbi:hypothetical protein D187_002411 [Cystobacter fuscus DSM 2262]|uniref:Uncharacterized protein n=1 Tax=Cystobacter fuscus (strain ATCC 25194 / DSM 2262 / NBRC 100088 / M29) TaxID=1242864 RepID=S9PBM9_CYSF2|nr:hypothetical protein D187_002411 [Cystobacter fuscus DSM 2262]